MHLSKKRASVSLLVVVSLFIGLILLTGCQSTDKADSNFDSSGLVYSKFEYDGGNDQTKITWATTLTNETIYDLNEFSVTFNLYSGSTFVRTENLRFRQSVKHGDSYTGPFLFYADGGIDRIEFVSWSGDYDTFWGTYRIWIIVTSAVASAAALIYVVLSFVFDFDPEDIGRFISDHGWILLGLFIPVAFALWGALSSWVSVLIVLGGVTSFILLSVILYLIASLVFSMFDLIPGKRRGEGVILDDDYEDDDEDDEYEDNKDDEYEDEEDDGFDEVDDRKPVRHDSSAPKSRGKITFKDIAGLEEAKNAFKEKVVYAFIHKRLYEKYEKKVGGGLLLYGLPGTGKTMFAEAASNETDALFIPVKCSDIKSKWYGESEAKVQEIFRRARRAKKAIIFFDEFEAIGAKRTDSENGNNDLVPQILAEMQGVGSSSEESVVMVIAATNKPWAIDSAFLRPGRFDEKIYIPLPDYAARKKLFELKLKTIPQKDLDYDLLANATDGFNGADIGAFCDKLKMLAINKSISAGADCPITMEDVAEVQATIHSSVSTEDVERLMEFKEQLR